MLSVTSIGGPSPPSFCSGERFFRSNHRFQIRFCFLFLIESGFEMKIEKLSHCKCCFLLFLFINYVLCHISISSLLCCFDFVIEEFVRWFFSFPWICHWAIEICEVEWVSGTELQHLCGHQMGAIERAVGRRQCTTKRCRLLIGWMARVAEDAGVSEWDREDQTRSNIERGEVENVTIGDCELIWG